MKQINIGVIGCGVIGCEHLKAIGATPGAKAVAVADIRLDAARKLASEFKVPAAYDSADALLADRNVQAVILAMPTSMRSALAPQALSAGKHLLLEKPAAMNVAELRQLKKLQGTLTVGCCTSRHLFLASAVKAAETIATGVLGDLRVLRVRAISSGEKPPVPPPPPWRLSKALNGGGIFANWGGYDLNYLLGLTGWKLKPQLVLAQCWKVADVFSYHAAPGSDGESHLAALIRCAGGEAITFERGEFVTSTSERAWQITGTTGSIHLDMLPGTPNQVILDKAVAGQGVVAEKIWEGNEDWPDVHLGVVRDFVQALQTGRPPQTDLDRALILQTISDAVIESATRGEAVRIVV